VMKRLQSLWQHARFRLLRVQLWVATRLVKPLDGTVVSTVALTQAVGQLAMLMNHVDRMGLLKQQPAKFRTLKSLVDEVGITLLASEQLGVPSMELEAVQGLYLIALDRSASRRTRAEGNYQKALRELMARFEARSKQLNARAKARALEQAQLAAMMPTARQLERARLEATAAPVAAVA